MGLTSRECLGRVLRREPCDRIPVDFGSTGVTGIHVRMVEALRRHYGLAGGPVKVTEPYQMLGEVAPDLREAMGIDVVGITPRTTMFGFENAGWREFRTFWGQDVLVPEGFQTSLDENGDLLIYPEGDRAARPSGRMPQAGFFFDTIVRQDPIDESALDPADNLEEFSPLEEQDLAYWKAQVAALEGTTHGVIANVGGTALGDIALVPGPWMKSPRGIRDIAEWYMATKARPDFVHAIFDRQCEIAIERLRQVHAIAGETIQDVFLCGTDFGTPDSQFLSPRAFRELWLPYYRRMNDWVHAHTGWRTFKHSCGSVEPLIAAFADAGFDVLNPVQVNAAHMDPQRLKDKHGERVIFWGGGADTQRILPFASPGEVESHVERQCEILGRNGGFVFNTVHNVQANVPVENVAAMVRALRRVNGEAA
jgi:uroporphyrinogen-III decarboxylase